MKIGDVLDQIGEDVLSAEAKEMLQEAFEESVDAQIKSRLDVEIQAALQKLDEQHYDQLQELLESVDKDHSDKFIQVVEKLDGDHFGKLEHVIKRYQKIINEDAKTFKASLVKQLSNYLDLYLEEAVPKQDIQEAVSNKHAQKVLHEIKQIVSVDEEFINDTIRSAVHDGKKQIELLKDELNESVKANIRLNQQNKGSRAELVLEKATKNFDKDKRNFVFKTLRGKDPEYIVENLDYVVKIFDRDDSDQRVLLAEKAKKQARSKDADTPKSRVRDQIITEDVDQNDEGDPVSEYLKSLEAQDKYKK